MKLIFSLLLLLFTNINLAVAEPKVSFSLSKRSILLGDSAIITINVQDVKNPQAPELPQINNFKIKFKGVRQESFSSFSVVINGKSVQKQSSGGGYNFEYELTPQKAGTFTLPALTIKIENLAFRTEPMKIEVFDKSGKSDDLFIKVMMDKKNVYLGEKIQATFKWYFNKNINNYQINVPWIDGLKNFLVTDTEIDNNRNYHRLIVNGDQQVLALKTREVYRGQSYVVISFKKILTPIATGKYKLEPVFLKCDVVTGYKRTRFNSFFDSFFDSGDGFISGGRNAITEPFATRSTPIDIVVKNVPGETMPSTYNGAVGNFKFDVKVTPRKLKAGEPITMTMKVSGSGSIEQVQLPIVPEMEVFKSYEPESKTDITQKGGQVTGTKTFEKVLIPKRHGNYTIPKIAFTFFNPKKRKYVTISKGPYKIDVEKSDEADSVRVIAIDSNGTQSDRRKKNLKIVTRDIRYIKTDIGQIEEPGNFNYKMLLAWCLGYVFPLSVYLGLFLWKKRRDKFSQDIAFARNYGALKKVKKLFKKTEILLAKNNARDFYSALSKSLNEYAADKLNRPAAGITPDVVSDLKEKGLSDENSEALSKLYQTFDMAMFSSFDFDQNKMKGDLEATKNIVIELEKVLK